MRIPAAILLSAILLNLAGLFCPGMKAQSRDSSASFEGRTVARISYDPTPQPIAMAELAEMLPLKKGDVYQADAVRESIERLYATGRYTDIQVDAEMVEGGVALKFITRGGWFVGHVGVETDIAEPPGAGQMVSAARLELGAAFDESQLAAAEENIRRLLVNDGYFEPEIEHRLKYDAAFQQVHITFAVRGGRRARYAAPAISGSGEISAASLENATRWHRFLAPGYRGVTQTRTRTGIDRIRLRYENANRLLATITLEGMEPSADGKSAKPHVSVEPGPTVEITAEGLKTSRKTLKQNVPVFEEHTVDNDLLAEGASNLRDYFQGRGYFDVEVTFSRQQVTDGKTEIVYSIVPGVKHRLKRLDIEGNKYFSSGVILERLFLLPSSFELRQGRYSEALRRRDEQAIAELYRSNGFRDVKVSSVLQDDYQGRKGDEAVSFRIEEGPQYRVAHLLIQGAARLDLTKTIRSLSSQADQVFSESNIASDRENIIQQYGDNGFADATFEWDAKPAAPPHTVDLTFTIREGEQQFVRQVVTTGLHTTKPQVVNRLLELNPNDPLSPSAMADTQRKLYDLGIFSQVNMAVQNPEGAEQRRYVLYDIEEARRYSVTGGVGAEFARIGGNNAITDLSNPGGSTGFSPRVSLAVSRLNLFGEGQSLSLQTRLSTLQKRAALNYFVPRIFAAPKFDATFSVLYDDAHDVRTFQAVRREGAAQIVQHYSKALTMFYRLNYREVTVSNLKINPLLLPLLAQSVRVGIASFNLVQDKRDNPTDPHKGVYNTLDIGLATKAFGSQTSFARVLGRNATYYRLGPKIILARETQFGVEPAFSIPKTSDPTDPIPLPERFFGGGGNTQRGFPENQAGPRDLLTGFPLGGSVLFFNNTELRFPLYGANISGVLFEDAGNVFSSLSKVTFRTDQRDVSDFDYMVHAAGFGVRYKTPVGPIRVDLAYSMNPPKYNGFPGSYTQLLQCSAANTCQASQQQISHFQFVFSIGQAF